MSSMRFNASCANRDALPSACQYEVELLVRIKLARLLPILNRSAAVLRTVNSGLSHNNVHRDIVRLWNKAFDAACLSSYTDR